MSDTSAGSSIAITASAPATMTEAGFSALTYTEIGGVESIPAFGGTTAVNSFQPLKGGQQKSKGPVNWGSLQVPMALDEEDAGQILLQTAADPENDTDYTFEVTLSTGKKRWFRGKVFGWQETIGGATNTLMATTTLEINTKPVKSAS